MLFNNKIFHSMEIMKIKEFVRYYSTVLCIEIETMFIVFTLYNGLMYLALCFLYSLCYALLNGFFYLFMFWYRFNVKEIVIETICYFGLTLYIARHTYSFTISQGTFDKTVIVFSLPLVILAILTPLYLYFKRKLSQSKWYINQYEVMLLCLYAMIKRFPILKFLLSKRKLHKVHTCLLLTYIILILCIFYMKYRS